MNLSPDVAAITLRITEIFHSLQGETRTVGLPTVFIRLTGCPLRCSYCDTSYAFQGGETQNIQKILDTVSSWPARHVCVTGGEPLAQKACLPLMTALCDSGYSVSLETSGALDIGKVDPRVDRVMDLKTPASKEEAKNRYQNLELLRDNDQLKFVIADRNDYDWVKQTISDYNLAGNGYELLVSPCFGQLDAAELAGWVLEDGLPVRFQLQLHKLLWGDAPGK